MKDFIHLFLLTALATIVGTGSINAQDAPSALHDHGVAPEPPTKVLPGNFLLHVQCKSPIRLIQNLDQFLVDTVPPHALPPDLQNLFATGQPATTLLGMQTLQEPLTDEAVVARLGLDPTQPVTLTVYPGDPSQFFILSLPIGDLATASAFVANALKPESMEEVAPGGHAMTRIQLKGTSLFATCSANRIYLSRQQALLMHLHDREDFPRLGADDQIQLLHQQADAADVLVAFNPGITKTILPVIDFYKYFPLSQLEMMRRQIIEQLPPARRKVIDRQIQVQLKLNGLEELADYLECVVAATYEELFEWVTREMGHFNGCSLALELDPQFPKLSFYLHSDSIQPENSPRPLPLEEILKSLQLIPGIESNLAATGRTPEVKPSRGISSWLKRARSKFEARNLDTTCIDSLENLHQSLNRPQPLTARADWVATANVAVEPRTSPQDYHTLKEWLQDLPQRAWFPTRRSVNVLPDQNPELLQEVFLGAHEARTHNDRMIRDLLQPGSSDRTFLIRDFRIHPESLGHDVTRLITENAFTTRGGLFGYNEHEFINRRILLAREIDHHLVYHQLSRNADWISALDPKRPHRLSPALQRLVDRLPEGINRFQVNRVLQRLPAALQRVADLEALAHRELDDFIKQAKASARHYEHEDWVDHLRRQTIPPTLFSLNRDPESGELYGLLPGGLAYPRPQLTSALWPMLEDFRSTADQGGGMLCYTRVLPGVRECSLVQNTESISRLIQSVGNTLFEAGRSPQETLHQLQLSLISPRDGHPDKFKEIVFRNPRWAFLPAGKNESSGTHPPKPAAQPKLAIEPRNSETPERLLDLSEYFNGSPNETWQKGGLQDNDLWAIPQGIQLLAGTPFDVRGILQLSSRSAREQLSVKLPEQVKGIPVGQKSERFHFLHGAGWDAPEGTRIGSYRFHYENGVTEEFPIVYGQHVRDWWTPSGDVVADDSEIAWKGRNRAAAGAGRFVQLYKTTWKNPHPGETILSVDYISSMTPSAPFLLGITLE